MSDEIDIALDALLSAAPAPVPDDGFSHGVLERIADAELQRSRVASALFAVVSCILFSLLAAVALKSHIAAPIDALPVAISLIVASLVLSRTVQLLFQE